MNPLIRKIVENEADKISQQTVLYMTPQMLDASGEKGKGARCGKCAFFIKDKSECFITSPAHCDAKHGVCGLFVGGERFLSEAATPQEYVPKTAAGYIESAPTFCSICEYWKGKKDAKPEDEGECEKVAGQVFAGGCCNGFEHC